MNANRPSKASAMHFGNVTGLGAPVVALPEDEAEPGPPAPTPPPSTGKKRTRKAAVKDQVEVDLEVPKLVRRKAREKVHAYVAVELATKVDEIQRLAAFRYGMEKGRTLDVILRVGLDHPSDIFTEIHQIINPPEDA